MWVVVHPNMRCPKKREGRNCFQRRIGHNLQWTHSLTEVGVFLSGYFLVLKWHGLGLEGEEVWAVALVEGQCQIVVIP